MLFLPQGIHLTLVAAVKSVKNHLLPLLGVASVAVSLPLVPREGLLKQLELPLVDGVRRPQRSVRLVDGTRPPTVDAPLRPMLRNLIFLRVKVVRLVRIKSSGFRQYVLVRYTRTHQHTYCAIYLSIF